MIHMSEGSVIVVAESPICDPSLPALSAAQREDFTPMDITNAAGLRRAQHGHADLTAQTPRHRWTAAELDRAALLDIVAELRGSIAALEDERAWYRRSYRDAESGWREALRLVGAQASA